MGDGEAGWVAGSSVDCEGVFERGWEGVACVWMGGPLEVRWYFRLVPLPREGPDGHLVEALASVAGGSSRPGGEGNVQDGGREDVGDVGSLASKEGGPT